MTTIDSEISKERKRSKLDAARGQRAAVAAKLIIVVNHAGFFLSHRLPVALAARRNGYEVVIVTPPSKHVALVERAGLAWLPLTLTRSGRNPVNELLCLIELFNIYRKLRPDVVHHVTNKVVILGTMAARFAKVPRVVNAISGLGHLFVSPKLSDRILKNAVSATYRFGVKHPNMSVIFQNREHLELFTSRSLFDETEAILIEGSGVDTNIYYPRTSTANAIGVPVVLFASRLLATKGIGDFVWAADQLRSEGLAVRCQVAGEPDPENPASVDSEQLSSWQRDSCVEFLGRRSDMPNVMRGASMFCLPTTYPEGVPKVLLEAAASGLPIVTTDTPGCRRVVTDGWNGVLIAPGDRYGLLRSIRELLARPEEARRMGLRGRKRVIDENLTTDDIVHATLDLYKARPIQTTQRSN